MPSSGASTQDAAKLTPFALERLLIVHESLAERSTGESLDEGASIEELSEQILYYHNSQNEQHQEATVPGGGGGNNDNDDGGGRESASAKEEAIQFAGFCSGLRSFPDMVSRTTSTDGNMDDATKEVYFNKSTLVFVPLEEQFGQPIMAIAQLARSSPPSTKPNSNTFSQQRGGANPLAIRTAIQKSHELFCLIRSGGIHWRLLQTNNTVSNDSDNQDINDSTSKKPITVCYPEMNRLYALRKKKRKLDKKLYRLSPKNEDEREALVQEAKETKEHIEELLRISPMKSLRADLRVHYDEFLSQLGVASSFGGAAGRCLVELVPTPVPLQSGAHLFQYAPASPSVRTTVRLGCVVQELLNRRDRSVETPDLLGISCFYQGRSICTHVLTTDEQPKICISPTTANLLLGHMKYVQQNSNINASNPFSLLSPTSASSNPSTPQRLNRALDRWSVRSLMGENRHEYKTVSSTPSSASSGEGTPVEDAAPADRRFLRPPPLSMLSASDRIYEANIPSYGPAWLPRIHLPSEENPDILTQVHTTLFEFGVYSFLIYIQRHTEEDFALLYSNSTDSDDNSIENAASPIESLLELTANHLSECMQSLREKSSTSSSIGRSASEDVESSSSVKEKKSTPERGEDIILVDREENSLKLVTHRKGGRKTQNSAAGGGPSTPTRERKTKRNPISFLGIGRNSRINDRSTSHLSDSSSAGSVGTPFTIQFPLNGFDCRHFLTAHLPLDVILAFDDTMNEIHNIKHQEIESTVDDAYFQKSRHRSKRERTFSCEGGKSSPVIKREICTFLPQGWMFAHVHNNEELYILFDSDKYITIADVQKGVTRVRNELFLENDSPPTTISASPM